MHGSAASMSLIDGILLDSSSDELSVKQCFVLVVAAGLLNSLITAYLLCRLPESHAPSLTSLFVRSLIYVLFGLVGGTVGAWLYWNRPPIIRSGGEPMRLLSKLARIGSTESI